MNKNSTNRAFSILTVKGMDDDQRIIRGMATTPEPDRVGDVVDPMGAQFKNPSPLLYMHAHDKPVGTVKFGKPTKEGIPFEAQIPKISEPSGLKARVDEAWESVKAGLISCVSIGFRALEWSVNEETGGYNFLRTDIYELSLVTVPANSGATISYIKSFDAEVRKAALGKEKTEADEEKPSGVTDKKTKTVKLTPKEGKKPMKTAEQIKNFNNERAAKVAKMEEIMAKSVDAGESLDEADSETYDTLQAEVETIDKHVSRLEVLQKAQLKTATPVKVETTEKAATQSRTVAQVKATKPNDAGIGMARFARCLGLAGGSVREAAEIAKSLYPNDEAVNAGFDRIKAVVAAGSTTDTTWAKPLVGQESDIFADFVEFLRPQTIIGQFGQNGVPALRDVPFYTRLVGQTSGGTANWVGEGKAKPVTKFDFNDTMLLPLKVAAIAVVTEELLRNSSPSADRLIRDGLVAAVRERLDIDFVDPGKAAVAGVSPASITNGVTPIVASGTGTAADVRTDIKALWQTYIANNLSPEGAVYIMSSMTALSISLMKNALGQPEFPGLTMKGGMLDGVPVIVSEYIGQLADTAGGYVFLVNAPDIYVGDDGGFRVDLSREATIQMDSAPTQSSTATVTPSTGVSMFQTNSVAFRAERTMNWDKRRESAVAVLSGVNWGAEE